MPRVLLLCALLLLSAVSLGAESQNIESDDTETKETERYDDERFRMGIAVAAELAGEVRCDNFFESILDSPAVFPGVYWEVILNHVGFGMTCFGKFNRIEDGSSEIMWEFDWIGSIDLRYHFTEKSFLDPFVEFGIGCAGRVELPCYNKDHDHYYEDSELLMISVFFQAGGGIAVRLDCFHAGLKLLYRIMNEPLPVTTFEVYPLYKMESVLFVGVSF
jgi:hypothetical protein